MRREFSFDSTNGYNNIHAVFWTPDMEKYPVPRGIVQISHGMIEYIDRYDELAGYLTARGFLVVGNDHLGHGKSVASQEDWGYFYEYSGSAFVVHDLHRLMTMVKKKFPGVPYFLLGHSMGSFMARRFIMTFGNEIDGVIIMGTGNQPKPVVYTGLALAQAAGIMKGDRYRSKSINEIMFGRYNSRIKKPVTPSDWISSDTAVVDKYVKTPECTFLFTVNGYKVLMKTLLFIEDESNIKKIPQNLPVYLMAGKDDPVGNYGRAVKEVYSIYKNAGIKDISLKLYDGFRHEIHNETGRQNVYADIAEWLESRI